MTRQAAPIERPVALTIATSDSGGGAGIQADLKTAEACGAFGTSVLCATTAQNTRGVESVHVLPIPEIEAQLDAIESDFSVGAAKTGMLATADVVEYVADRAVGFDFPLVVDPVMVATSGDRLLERAGESAYEDLIGEATLTTPNADEAAVLTGIDIGSERDAIEAGETLREMGAETALVKGGHVPGETIEDVLVTGDGSRTIAHPRIEGGATHGSGCTLASAIAAGLAHGTALEEAVTDAIALLGRAVRYPLDVGTNGAVHHHVALREQANARDVLADVRTIADRLVARDSEALAPETGITVLGASAYAETRSEIAITTIGGARVPGEAPVDPRFGADEREAAVLLAAREARADLRYAVEWRPDREGETALAGFDGPVVSVTDTETEAGGLDRAVTDAIAGSKKVRDGDRPTIAVVDRRGPRSRASILAADAESLAGRSLDSFGADEE